MHARFSLRGYSLIHSILLTGHCHAPAFPDDPPRGLHRADRCGDRRTGRPSISGRELSVGASDVQQYLDGSFPRTQDALGGLIALTMSHPQLSLPAGERLNLGMDVALATAGGSPAKLGTVKLSSGLRYDAQTQGFHLQQPSVDDFTPASQGGRLDSRTRSLLNAWLSDYAQREPIYKLDPAVAGLLGACRCSRPR